MKSLKRHISLLLTILCVTIMQAHDSHWSFNFRDYKYDMTIYAQLIAEEGQVSSYDNYEIAAFVGDECRSVGQPQEKDGYKWVYLRVWSNETSGEKLTFKLYDRTLDEEIVLRSDPVAFQANDQVGQASQPLSLLKISNEYRVITFDTDGGTLINPITQKIGEAVTAPEAPTKTGYTFAGWDKEVPTTMPAEDMTIKALWTINQYTISFDTDGGSTIAPITQDYNTDIATPGAPTKTGYTFAGWDKEIPAMMPAENLTIKATWSINQYTITFDTDGGSEITPITQDYNTAVTAPANPTKTGYTFAEWDKEVPTTMPAEDITIKALWTINSYKLTYKVDGEVYKQYDVEYKASIIPETAPEKEGYTFSGWSEIPTTMPANDVEVTGTFTVNQYKVTFIVDGEVVKEETLDFGTTITAPENPTKVGHTFTGWNPAVDANVPSHDVTYTAQFTVNQYTITFDTDGGSEITPITQDYNTAVTAPANPTKTGYTFAEWDKEVPTTMPAEDITIKALWTINVYKLTYLVDGEVYKEYEVEYGAAIEPEPEPTKEDWTFSGWKEDIPATMPAHDVVITGSFDVFTSITSVNAESSENQVIYNINGVRSNKIQKGLNIVNGRKIIK